MQETKLSDVSPSIVIETLGADFDAYFCLPATDTRGGIIVAWKSRMVQLDSAHIDVNSVTARVTPPEGAPWWLTCVYGPQLDVDKIAFLDELREVRRSHPGPWVLCGDFNMIYRDEDKNNDNLHRRMMGRFRRFLNDCALKEIYLHGRRYTWSNERASPTLVRLDRVFCTSDWDELHSSCSLRCLSTVISDHCPLLLDCTLVARGRKRFQFESYWLKLEGFRDVVDSAWTVVDGDPDPFRRLVAKLKRTARRLMSWADKMVGSVKLQLMIAREVVYRLDVAMESRPLTADERALRARLKCTYLGLASLERTMARQRAKVAWLKEGDANTTFFHQHATYRRQKNVIHSLTVDGAVIGDHAAMAEATFEHFQSLLGTAVDREFSLDLDFIGITAGDLSELEHPFTEDKIWEVVRRLPHGKAPGPDGFTAEFLRCCWGTVKADFMLAFHKLHTVNGRGFQGLNQALITLLPKRCDAASLGDYRPISLIHIFAKLVAKVLASRLAPRLGAMVDANQCAFIQKRCIHDNFMMVQQTARLLHRLKEPRVMLKLDIARAFDSVSWPMLLEVLRKLGFGPRFRELVAILFSTASTRVLLNGEPGPPIWHRRGLRQGDPLSPMLFVLYINTLNRVLAKAKELGVLRAIAPRELGTSVSLYADDVVIFCHPDATELRTVRAILALFGEASGLHTNFAKCSVSPIACTDEVALAAAAIMGCQLAPFPVKYLGIPLTIGRLPASALQPLVDSIADRLPAWKAAMMTKAGRLTLVKAVLMAIPLHQLIVLGLHKKVLKQVNRIVRGFLWAGRAEANGGHCHVNWAKVCRPLSYGGLGIPDLARMATSLRTRWIWRMRTDPLRPWHGIDMHFSKIELAVFNVSTRMDVGDGNTALFWLDSWLDGRAISEIAPDLFALVPGRARKRRTVREALAERRWIADIQGALGSLALWQYVQLWVMLREVTLAPTPDRLLWRWTTDAQYSSKSCYEFLFQGSLLSSSWKLTWRTWAPPRVKFFVWLACQDRCWTGERLARRGLQHPTRCPLCDQAEETMRHLLTGCPFSLTVWHEVLSWIRSTAGPPDGEDDFVDWWKSALRSTPRALRKGTSSLVMLTAWWIWKHRNAIVFDNARPNSIGLLDTIRSEARSWVLAGATGLGALVPSGT
jgi:exonuclease III